MKLLVTLDGSTLAEEVLPPVAKLAAEGNEVVMTTVVRPRDGDAVWKRVQAASMTERA
jgi:copper homeostasis protein CutC